MTTVAGESGGELARTATVGGQQWWSVRGEVSVSVQQQRHDHRPEIESLLGGCVFVPVGAGLIELALQDPGLGEPGQSVAQYVVRDTQAGAEILESAHTA